MSEHNIKFQSYYAGQMTEEDSRQFEAALKVDVQLASDYALYVSILESEEKLIADQLKSKMARWKSDPPPPPENQKKTTPTAEPNRAFPNWKLLLPLVGLLGLIAWLWMRPPTPATTKSQLPEVIIDTIDSRPSIPVATEEPASEDKVNPPTPTPQEDKPARQAEPSSRDFAYVDISHKYYQDPEDLFSTLKSGKASDSQDSYAQALSLFQKNKYKEALSLIKDVNSADNSYYGYLKGHLYYKLRQYANAEREWTPIANDDFLPMYEEARWYLFLSLTAQLPKGEEKWGKLKNEIEGEPNYIYRDQLLQLISELF